MLKGTTFRLEETTYALIRGMLIQICLRLIHHNWFKLRHKAGGRYEYLFLGEIPKNDLSKNDFFIECLCNAKKISSKKELTHFF